MSFSQSFEKQAFWPALAARGALALARPLAASFGRKSGASVLRTGMKAMNGLSFLGGMKPPTDPNQTGNLARGLLDQGSKSVSPAGGF